MTTRAETMQRLIELEEILRRTIWTRALSEKLAQRWGTSPQTVERLYRRTLRDLVRRRPAPEERRREIVAGVEGLISEVRKTEPRAAINGYRLLAQLEGLLQTAPEVAISINIERADPLALLQGMAEALASVEGTGLLAGPVIDAEEIE